MTSTSRRITGRPRLIILGLLGAFVGAMIASFWNPLPIRARTHYVPAAYRLPKIPAGTPLRLAMVHDVLHERYLRHGEAWYRRRNADARKIIDQQEASAQPSLKYLDAMDDLGIGLESVGSYDDAIAILRKELTLVSPVPASPTTRPQGSSAPTADRPYDVDLADLRRIVAAQHLSPLQYHQYTACANLGTVLVHSAMAKAMANDPQAKEVVREGLGLIHRAIAINPGAHFGRETWQAIVIEHLLAATDHPELLTEFDAIGEPLETQRFYTSLRARGHSGTATAEPTEEERVEYRSNLPRVGIAAEWAEVVQPDYPGPMPFDEPTLAIIGMWTLGGGPSPHFALALGNMMEGLEQHHIAWNAYERVVELSERFWPDAAVRQKIVTHCRARQQAIAEKEAPDGTKGWQDHMRQVHTSELAWGAAYQKAYQDFEAAQIAAGVPLDASDFYKPFFENRASIASAPGLADDIAITNEQATNWLDVLPCLLLGAGVCMYFGTSRMGRREV